jgi:hypothetical protein
MKDLVSRHSIINILVPLIEYNIMASDRARDAPSPVQERTVGTPTARSESLQQRLMKISPNDIGVPSASQPDQLMGQGSPYGGLGGYGSYLENEV